MDLYAPKAGLVGALAPVVRRLAAAGVSPDAVTLAAVPVAAAGGACLLASPGLPALLLAVPFLAGLRLVLNLLDGALARSTGRSHPRGEVFNEVGDRLADIALLAPVAWLPGASPQVVLPGVIGAIMASYVGITTKAAGGRRLYRGVLSKPGRMLLLAGGAIGAYVYGPDVWAVFGVLLCIGVTLTFLERIVIAVRSLP